MLSDYKASNIFFIEAARGVKGLDIPCSTGVMVLKKTLSFSGVVLLKDQIKRF